MSRNEFAHLRPIRPINGRKRPFSDCLCIRPTKSVWNKGEKPSKSSQKLEEIIPKVLRNGRKKKCQEMGERALTHVFVALCPAGQAPKSEA